MSEAHLYKGPIATRSAIATETATVGSQRFITWVSKAAQSCDTKTLISTIAGGDD